MPNPGPFGGSLREVRPANGSAANRPFLGPAFGFFPAARSAKIDSMSAGVKSSFKTTKQSNLKKTTLYYNDGTN